VRDPVSLKLWRTGKAGDPRRWSSLERFEPGLEGRKRGGSAVKTRSGEVKSRSKVGFGNA
jgi:hypothetical protein